MGLFRLRNVFKLIFNFVFKTKRRGLTVKAVFYTAVARYRVFFYPGNRLHRYLGEQGSETGNEVPDEERRRDLFYVSDKVKRVANRVPWESKCLVQGMVAQRMLRDYGIGSTLYLGVGRDKEENGAKMIAHAWVRSGSFSICGGNGEGYAIVAKFRM